MQSLVAEIAHLSPSVRRGQRVALARSNTKGVLQMQDAFTSMLIHRRRLPIPVSESVLQIQTKRNDRHQAISFSSNFISRCLTLSLRQYVQNIQVPKTTKVKGVVTTQYTQKGWVLRLSIWNSACGAKSTIRYSESSRDHGALTHCDERAREENSAEDRERLHGGRIAVGGL